MLEQVCKFGRLVATTVAGLAVASAASAQSFGLRAGASGSPDQFYAGLHAETAPIARRVTFRPNVEVGVGDRMTALTANFEFVYRTTLRASDWDVFLGGGPTANYYEWDRGPRGDSDFGGGINLLIGLEHNRRVFAEFKVGLIDSPHAKLGIGINLGR